VYRDLIGMDAHLSLEAVSQCCASRGFQAGRVGQINPDRIQRRVDVGRAGCSDNNCAGVGKLGLAPAPSHVHVKREVAGTEGNAPDACARRKDRVDLLDTARRLDDRDQIDITERHSSVTLELRQQPIDRCEIGRAFDLRENDAVQTGLHDRHQIVIAEFGVNGVDPDIKQSLPGTFERSRHYLACRRFLGDRHSIFEIQDHGVGIE
jgi:hypothetical protein